MSKISTNPAIDPDLQIENPILIDLLAYWRQACAGRPMPARADIDPVQIKPALLPYILLVDVEHGPRYRWRLISTHITMVLDRDKTGAYWDDIYDGEEIASMTYRADWVVRHRLPLRSTGHCIERDRDYDYNEALFMPLSDDGSVINMMMMGSVYTVPLSP
jgi:hypothetical protein